MNSTLKLPVGIENFEEIRKSGFYYVDKTKLIEQLLQNWGKVNLFTRPRRFGKTLQTGIYPLAMVLPCDYHPHGIQGNTFLIAAKGDGEFFMEIAVEHAAQKALKASVVLKNHIFHGLIPHRTATAAGIPLPGADLVP